jgi:hypothetical protein
MRMRVDEAWQHDATGGVESLRTARKGMSLNLCAGTHGDDEAIGDEHRAIFYKPYIGKRIASAGSAATQS